MTIERRILQILIAHHGQHRTYPTIARIAAILDRSSAEVADIVLTSKRFDYTVPVRGTKSWRDDASNWTVEPVDLGRAYQELGGAR